MKKWFLGIILAIGFISLSIVAPTYAAGAETAVSTNSRQAVSPHSPVHLWAQPTATMTAAPL
ncbi:MAG: hypothetical protein M5U34_15830 [Chloroflexi bacterium]|nr:hypothetical protein [Chloroflexota bacterium]